MTQSRNFKRILYSEKMIADYDIIAQQKETFIARGTTLGLNINIKWALFSTTSTVLNKLRLADDQKIAVKAHLKSFRNINLLRTEAVNIKNW